jgi:hypothetical protein
MGIPERSASTTGTSSRPNVPPVHFFVDVNNLVLAAPTSLTG